MTKQRRFNLTDLLLDEISLVDRPANPGARVLLFKGSNPAAAGGSKRGTKPMNVTEIIAKSLASLGVAEDQIEAATDEIEKALGELHTAEDVTKAVEEAVAKAKDEAKEGFDAAVSEAVEKALAEKQADPIEKAKEQMSPEARERFEKMEAENKANAEAIEKMKAERREEKLRKRAEGFEGLAPVDDVLEVFKSCDDETVDAIEKVLEKAAKQMAEADKILTKSVGTSTPTEGTAYAELTKLADELVKKEADAGTKISHSQAFKRVCEDSANAELWKRHRAESANN